MWVPGSNFGLTEYCAACNSTHVIPFRIDFQPGLSLYRQVVYAAKKAVIAGHMRPGDPFPSVRALSKELKINPNTAHKVIARLAAEGMLEIRPGLGAFVTERPLASALERTRLLEDQFETLVVEAKRLEVGLDEALEAFSSHWARLDGTEPDTGTAVE